MPPAFCTALLMFCTLLLMVASLSAVPHGHSMGEYIRYQNFACLQVLVPRLRRGFHMDMRSFQLDFVIKCFMHDLRPIIDNIPTLGLFCLAQVLKCTFTVWKSCC